MGSRPWAGIQNHFRERSDPVLVGLGAESGERGSFPRHLFSYRRDKAVGGEPLQLDGVVYAKGLGVHSRTILEYPLEKGFSTFVARVGIQETVGRMGDATVQVLGDGRSLYKGRVRGGEGVVDIVLPVGGYKVLRLETDYGEDVSARGVRARST